MLPVSRFLSPPNLEMTHGPQPPPSPQHARAYPALRAGSGTRWPSPSAPLPPSEPAAVVAPQPVAVGTPPSLRPPASRRDGLAGELIAPAAAAARLSVTAKVLERWRATGVGPAFVMLTSKTIRYRPEDVDAFIADRMRAGTVAT